MHILFLGHDIEDAAVQRRVSGLRAQGIKVTAFSYQRGTASSVFQNSLGCAKDGNLLSRAKSMLHAISVLISKKVELKDLDAIYARNLDLAIVGLIVNRIFKAKAKLFYEVLDIHPSLSSNSMKGRILRCVEKRILSASKGLIVSSPGFIEEYFLRTQNFTGRYFLMENKVDAKISINVPNVVNSAIRCPLTIVYSGKLRCFESLRALKKIAVSRPNDVRIRVAGVPLEALRPAYLALVSEPNVEAFGEYKYPDDLEGIYSGADLNWSIDFHGDFNSKNLIPNRIYEGGAFGVPPLVLKGTATAKHAKAWEAAIEIREPLVPSLEKLIDGQRDFISEKRRNLAALPRRYFIVEEDYKDLRDFLLDSSKS